MSQTSLEAISRSNYQFIFDSALEAYRTKTGKDLTTDPLLRSFETCHSPDAILNLLRAQILGPGQSHSSSDNLTTWLIPTVNVINAFSTTVGEVVGLVSLAIIDYIELQISPLMSILEAYPPAGVIFTGIGVLLSAVKGVSAGRGPLVDLFTRIENIFRRLETYIVVPLAAGMSDVIVGIMVEILCVLAIVTKDIKQNRAEMFLKKLVGRTNIENALQRLENMTLEETRMTGAETLKAVHGIDNKVDDKMNGLLDALQVVQDKVGGVEGMLQGVTDMLQGVGDKVHGVDGRVKDISEKVLKSVEIAGQRTENDSDTLTIHGLEGVCDSAVNVEGVRSTVKDTGSSRALTRDGLERMAPSRASNIDDLSRDQSRQKSAEWLSPPDPSVNYIIARDTHHKGTAAWFIESNTFREWKQSGCLLWIRGKPGSGKSVLTSAIIQDIDCASNRGSARIAYFFFDFKDSGKQDARAFISSILIQLSSQSTFFCDILLEFYSAHERGSQQPSDSALIECLEKMLKASGKFPIYVIVDALDECLETSGQSPREKVLTLVKELVGLRLQNLRLCVTSRPHLDIRNVLEPLTSTSNRISLHDEDGQKKDIADYVHSVVYTDKKTMRWREKDKELVAKTLSDRAGGMFRWASCQFDALRRCLPPSLSRVLEELPETLDETYERILQEIPKPSRVFAHRLLQCLVVAARPLRVQELAEVLAVDFNGVGGIPKLNEDWRSNDQEQAVLTACSSLVEVITFRDSRMVQFSHHSVKEFLASDRLAATKADTLRYHHIRLDPAHTIMAQACVSVLLRLAEPINNETMRRFPLADYATKHFADHAEFGNAASQITNAIDELLDEDKPHFVTWMSHISSSWWAEKYSGHLKASPLYHVADLGFRCLVQHLVLKHPQDVVVRGGTHGTPMHAALRRRHVQVFQLLLPHCFDLEIRDTNGETPLHLAVANGLLEVVQLIIGRSADINARDDNGWTPLHQIINTYPQFDDSNLEIMRLLLDHGADVEAQDIDHVTPLCQAVRNGQLAATQLLVKHGAMVGRKDKLGRTPLHDASFGGDPDIIRLLLEHGADIRSTDDKQVTPLHLSADQGNLAAALLLVESGAVVDARGDTGWTSLHVASAYEHLDIIWLLLGNDANIQAIDVEHNTPLHIAANQGKFAAAQLLVEYGANVHARDIKNRTPLHDASWGGYPDIIRLLLEHGADFEAIDDKQVTPLHLAANHGKLTAARLLLERGAILHMRSSTGWTPLHDASHYGSHDIIQLLLEHGADIQAADCKHNTPLHIAADQGKLAATRLLVEHGAMVQARNNKKWTPLHDASWGGYPDIIRLLLEHGADSRAVDDQHATPLHLATNRGSLAVAQLLIEHNAVVHAIGDEHGRTPLHVASYDGYPDIIRLLLEHGADIQATDDQHNTPLHIAANQGKLAATELLVERGAIVHARGNMGWTPLHHASCGGSPDIMRLLLDHRADADAQSDNRDTPLHIAVIEEHLEAARLLLAHGANVFAQNKTRRTPLQLALAKRNQEIINLLSVYVRSGRRM